jgi:hypothetical protein
MLFSKLVNFFAMQERECANSDHNKTDRNERKRKENVCPGNLAENDVVEH